MSDLPNHNPPRILLIADDLTGACDAAAAFLPQNSVRVWLGATGDSHETVQAFNTDSRHLPPDQAAQAVANCADTCPQDALLFKKIDSAGRGPIAAELLAAHEAFATDLVLLAPSFPAHGRTVLKGVLHIQHANATETQLPLLNLFAPEHHALIATLDDPADLPATLASGKQIAICNAETQADLEAFAQAAAALPARVLYAGSSGLARAIATLNPAPATHSVQPETAPNPLLIVGTDHPVTQLQLNHLTAQLPTANLLRIPCKPADAETVRTHFATRNPQALILTGGDTALLALRSLGAHSISLRGEIAPGIPWGIIHGGLAHHRTVVTKSGGFGHAGTLTHILQTLAGAA